MLNGARPSLAIALALAGCVGVDPGQSDVVGKWRVSWTCGVEDLELEKGGTYVYSIRFSTGEVETDRGRWEISPMKSRLDGAQVVLKNAHLGCAPTGERTKSGERGDRRLRTVFEWGRTVLIFNPDIQGFTGV